MCLRKVTSSYSRVFTGYIIDNLGNQVVLFTTYDKSEVEDLCKSYVVGLKPQQKIYVDCLFALHSISVFKF